MSAARDKAKAGARLRIRQVRSSIGYERDQQATLRGLGLRRTGAVSELVDSPEVRGMLVKVRHLVQVEEA
jgi:large subunit ribosomal protein L30